jgi:nitrogen fixation protein FixH
MGRTLAGIVVVLALTLAVSSAAQSGVAALILTTKPSPLGLGQNVFEVSVKDAKGQPVTNATVALLLVMPADPKTKHPEMRTEGMLNAVGGGTYSGIAIVTMAGEWDVTVTARRDGKVIGEKKARLTAYATAPTKKK